MDFASERKQKWDEPKLESISNFTSIYGSPSMLRSYWNAPWRHCNQRLLSPIAMLAALAVSRVEASDPDAARGIAAKPNILFILCDDLGINDLHCYGRQDHHTPNLDRLAGQGMRFTSAYCAQPICSPSRAAILTGKTPARLHLTTFLPGRPDCVSQKVLHPGNRNAGAAWQRR